MRSLIFLLFFQFAFSLQAQSVLGKWKTVDDRVDSETSIVEITKTNGLISGKIIKLLDRDQDAKCTKCKKEFKDKPLLGMRILWDLKPTKSGGEKGKIIDPTSGNEYLCIVSLEGPDTLKIRGYLGDPKFGKTLYWYRVN